ncbi:MAG: hypothetical protein M1268_04590 [Patescibacteria group bacterium]|nr:hypothetical protein [Patescibacteria group bacterium]
MPENEEKTFCTGCLFLNYNDCFWNDYTPNYQQDAIESELCGLAMVNDELGTMTKKGFTPIKEATTEPDLSRKEVTKLGVA